MFLFKVGYFCLYIVFQILIIPISWFTCVLKIKPMQLNIHSTTVLIMFSNLTPHWFQKKMWYFLPETPGDNCTDTAVCCELVTWHEDIHVFSQCSNKSQFLVLQAFWLPTIDDWWRQSEGTASVEGWSRSEQQGSAQPARCIFHKCSLWNWNCK